MATPPFNINETLPGDTDVVSQHPANARTFRDVVEDWLLLVSDTMGRIIVAQGNTAARDALANKVDGTLFVLSDQTPKLLQRWNGAAWENLGPVVASEAAAGMLEIATQTEWNTGTDDARAGTSFKMANYAPPWATVTPEFANDKIAIRDNSDAGKMKLVTLADLRHKYAVFQNQRASGTLGPNFAADTWATYPLTTEVVDTDGIASLAANQITLANAGTYRISWTCTIIRDNVTTVVASRLRNITDGTTIGGGVNAGASGNTVGGDNLNAVGDLIFTIATGKTVAVQVYPTNTTDTLSAATSGENEIYATIVVEKLPV